MAPRGDFRRFRWGDSIAAVDAAEVERSLRIDARWSFQTKLAEFPVILTYSSLADVLAGAHYRFPWPGESEHCRGRLALGSRCSLNSASYAIKVCARIGEVLSQKYVEQTEADDVAVMRVPRYGSELDKQLAVADPGDDRVVRQWANDRVTVFQVFARGRKDGEGWRCTFGYRPTPEIEQQLVRQAAGDANDAAKEDL